MQREVINAPEFVRFAKQSLVLVDSDLTEAVRANPDLARANAALRARFNVGEQFPTVVLLNDSGETLYQETGYSGGGPSELLGHFRRHTSTAMTTDASEKFLNVTVPEFAKLAADNQKVILDVRTKKEFDSGHIPGAVNLDVLASDFDKQAAALDKGKTYLVHCASGVRSVNACRKLSALNIPKLYNLAGGFKAWEKAGQPVEPSK